MLTQVEPRVDCTSVIEQVYLTATTDTYLQLNLWSSCLHTEYKTLSYSWQTDVKLNAASKGGLHNKQIVGHRPQYQTDFNGWSIGQWSTKGQSFSSLKMWNSRQLLQRVYAFPCFSSY